MSKSQVGISRRILDDARHRVVERMVDPQDLADGIVVAEIAAGRLPGEHGRIRGLQGLGGIPLEQTERKDVEDRRVGPEDAFFEEEFIPVFDGRPVAAAEADDALDLGELFQEVGGDRPVRGRQVEIGCRLRVPLIVRR